MAEPTKSEAKPPLSQADALFAKVRELLGKITTLKTDDEVAADLNVSKSQAREWLQRLVEEGLMEKHTKPVRYGPKLQRFLLK
jgi:predicted transcriptional regulator